jgi:hypothetical protein
MFYELQGHISFGLAIAFFSLRKNCNKAGGNYLVINRKTQLNYFVPIPLGEFWGSFSIVLQVSILFLLILGLNTVKGGTAGKRNLELHGYLTILALVMHTLLTFFIMIPAHINELGKLSEVSFGTGFLVWSYVLLGSVVEILGFRVVLSWVSKPLSDLACLRVKKLMLPLFVIWEISAFIGVFIQIRGIL